MTAGIPYTVNTGEMLVNETFGPNNIHRRRTGKHELRPMPIRDGRSLAGGLSLDGNGFVFVEHKTRVRDFFDAGELKAVYYPEVERLIKDVSGASRVVLFDHTLRSGNEGEREARLVREPVVNLPNICARSSGAMPTPVSVTDSSISSPVRRDELKMAKLVLMRMNRPYWRRMAATSSAWEPRSSGRSRSQRGLPTTR